MLLTAAVLAAEPATRLSADDLLRLARPTHGECYLTRPPASIPGAPAKLFAWASASGLATVRVPVPADGYYLVSSTALWGPWADGRLGRFILTAGSAKFPNAYQGWYAAQPNPPYRMRELAWGVAYLSAPAVDLSFEPTGGSGRLMVLADLRLEPRAAQGLKPEDRDRKVPAAMVRNAEATATAVGTAWLQFELKQQRGNEWTSFIPRAARSPKMDGNLGDWQMDEAPILIDASVVPKRGWASPPPESDADLSARVALSWDDKFLYLAAVVRDDEKTPHGDKDAWQTPYGCDGLVVNITPPGWLTSGGRSQGPSPLLVSYGLSYYSPGASPRPLGPGCRYVVAETNDGYTIEASISFASLGWTPAMVGDRFPLGLILVDGDPHKPGGRQFHQYGWSYGPGSVAGTGEARLLGAGPAAGELIPERDTTAQGAPLRYVGTIDAQGPATLEAIEVVEPGSGSVVASFHVGRALTAPGRYRLWGELPLPKLKPGRYDLRLELLAGVPTATAPATERGSRVVPAVEVAVHRDGRPAAAQRLDAAASWWYYDASLARMKEPA